MKRYLYSLLAVLAILFGAYGLGHRSAKRSVEIKKAENESKVLRKTLDISQGVRNEVNPMSSDDVQRRLHDDWMRK